MGSLTYANGLQTEYIDSLYNDYKKNPESVDSSWRSFFEGFDLAYQNNNTGNNAVSNKETDVLKLIQYYRDNGHLFAKTNPIDGIETVVSKHNEPLLTDFNLTESDLDSTFVAGNVLGLNNASLKAIIELLKKIYCSTLGYEFSYITDKQEREWLQNAVENPDTNTLAPELRTTILKDLNKASLFEDFLHTKFVGKKRFSLEGGETLIPSLHLIADKSSDCNVKKIIIGMAHRGRLNTLVNILGKPYVDVFAEFDGKGIDQTDPYGGDTSYHMGYENIMKTSSGKDIYIGLCPNPSHLETVNSITEGLSRALIDTKLNSNKELIPVLIHGDAAVAGQGIVYEVTQMASLPGYETGGTIHIIINNFVGFTTDAFDERTALYCSDIAKIIETPVLHVNGMDPDAVAFASELALKYRQKFNKDVWIDLRCYRKYGHNEGDEPRFTQPILYKQIDKTTSVNKLYAEKLINENIITKEQADKLVADFKAGLQTEFEKIKKPGFKYVNKHVKFNSDWDQIQLYKDGEIDTKVQKEQLLDLAKKISKLPDNKKFINKTVKLFADREKMSVETQIFDWGMGELLAYATLLNEGSSVRISGEDVKRGTFSHRHAVIKTDDTQEAYIPLTQAIKDNSKFSIYNSLLSEYGVLGFEYGYGLGSPLSLTVWEAQFGDFANGAQIIYDQYITSAYQKWKLSNALISLLPHGYEGQGPEHSSARIERYLGLCANNNMFINNLTTPAQFFHSIRRQIKAPYRIPLVVFTPKSLLRHPKCVSKLSEFVDSNFKEIIDDSTTKKSEVTRVLICSGKVYYDLLDNKENNKRNDIAIIRLEQLYPFNLDNFSTILKAYKNAKEYIWVQEEPENMGPWPYLCQLLRKTDISIVSRPAASSPATGYTKNHIEQQKEIVNKAFGN
ncbi:MAG: 2-oxoglutarate dehydrogenase E1 component [Solitalea-like symbiont of Tyrophagus putrescentiae]